MKNAAHQYEDKLLEFAYGELARPEADAVEAHVRGCAKCSQQLSEIKGVRATMSALPMVAAPDAGLESLMAFAEQAAKRNATSQVKPSFWKRYMAPLVTVMALAVVGVIGMQAKDEFDTNPASVAADTKLDQLEKAKEQEVAAKQAEADGKKDVAPMPVAAVAPVAQPAPEQEPVEPDLAKPEPKPTLAKKPVGKVGLDDLVTKGGLDANKQGGKFDSSQASPVPESATRRSKSKQAPMKDPDALGEGSAAGDGLRQDYGNARGGYVQSKDSVPQKEAAAKKNEAPKEAPAQVWAPPPAPPPTTEKAEKVSFGLGTSAPGSNSLGATGGAPVATAEPKAAPREEQKRDAPSTADDFDKTYGPSTPRQATKTAPSAPAPAPSKKSSYTLSPMASSSGSGRSMEDEAMKAPRNEARAGLDDDASLVASQRAQFRTDALSSMREASNRGDRTGEVQLGLKVLNMGATGAERAEALKRVCDAYDALGEPESADPYCRQLIKEFPGTTAAKVVAERRSSQRAAPAKKPAAVDRERKAYDAEADQKKPADAPASSY